MKEKFICKECGGDSIVVLSWINPNTLEPQKLYDKSVGGYPYSRDTSMWISTDNILKTPAYCTKCDLFVELFVI